jgi:hypothetical protein
MSDASVPDNGPVPRSIAQWAFVDRISVERDDLTRRSKRIGGSPSSACFSSTCASLTLAFPSMLT